MPTIAGPENTDEADEPGGSTCYKCHEQLAAGDYAYREVFGEIDHTVEQGVVFGTTGGVPVRHFCQDCWNEHRGRDKAAHYDVTDGDHLWGILEAANGELVADLRPMLIGGRAWIRVVDGEVEARHTTQEMTEDGIRFGTEPTEEFDLEDFGHYFDDPNDRTRVLLKPADETPFREERGENG